MSDTDIEEEHSKTMSFKVKRKSLESYVSSRVLRPITEEENKIIKQLEQLEPWKQFAKSEYFKKVPNLELNLKKPCFGVTGRLPTDEMPDRFDAIPKILEFFREGGKAAEYQAQGLSALDIFVIFNYNFIGNEENSTRKRDNTGRDFYRDEHISLPDIEAALKKAPRVLDNKRHHNTYVLPEVLQKRLLGQLAESFETVTETIKSYGVPVDKQKNKPITEYKALICRHKHCTEYYMSLAMVCCAKKPLCLRCAVKMANEKAVKWLFEPIRVRCNEKCPGCLDYPITSQQVIGNRQYIHAFERLSVCKDCLRGYDTKHKCHTEDIELMAKAARPDDPEWIRKPFESDENTSFVSNYQNTQRKVVEKRTENQSLLKTYQTTDKTVSEQRANTEEPIITDESPSNAIDENDSNSTINYELSPLPGNTENESQGTISESQLEAYTSANTENEGQTADDENQICVNQSKDQTSIKTQNNEQQSDDNVCENTESSMLCSYTNRETIGTQEALDKMKFVRKKSIALKIRGLTADLCNLYEELRVEKKDLKKALIAKKTEILYLKRRIENIKTKNNKKIKRLTETDVKLHLFDFAKKLAKHQKTYMTGPGFETVFKEFWSPEIIGSTERTAEQTIHLTHDQ